MHEPHHSSCVLGIAVLSVLVPSRGSDPASRLEDLFHRVRPASLASFAEPIRDAVRELGDDAIPILEKRVAGRDATEARAAAVALGDLGSERAGWALVGALRTSRSPAARSAVALSLGRMDFEPALKPLCDAFDGIDAARSADDRRERALFALALAMIGDPSLAPKAIDLIRTDTCYRDVAAAALSLLPDDPAIDRALRGWMNGRDADLRRLATLLAGARRASEFLSGVSRLATDRDASVREAAALALGDLGDASSRHIVESLLDDANRAVRLAAAASMKRIRESRPPQLSLRPPEETRVAPRTDGMICNRRLVAEARDALTPRSKGNGSAAGGAAGAVARSSPSGAARGGFSAPPTPAPSPAPGGQSGGSTPSGPSRGDGALGPAGSPPAPPGSREDGETGAARPDVSGGAAPAAGAPDGAASPGSSGRPPDERDAADEDVAALRDLLRRVSLGS